MMQTSDPGNPDWLAQTRGQIGFTLIEILVVLLLMGIVSALVVANIAPDNTGKLRIESEKLALLLEQAAEEAHTGQKELGWSTEGAGYAFWQRQEDGEWIRIDEGIYRPRNLPDEMRIEDITVNQNRIAPGARLVFEPSGINQPFEMILAERQEKARLSSDSMNRVTSGPADFTQ
ncbi:MAG: GspH/FimT family pseudopilin [Burkholderiales bacterium]